MHLRLCEILERYPGSTGAGVRVAIVDSGVERSHPGLAGVPISGACIVERLGRVQALADDGIDVAGHGTACAGRVLGIAPGVQLVSCRVLNRSIRTTSRALLGALDWLLEQEGIGVVNLSLGTPNREFGLEMAERIDALAARGIPVVAARGYESQPDYPSAFATPVSVLAGDGLADGDLAFRRGEVVEFAANGAGVEALWSNGRRLMLDGSSIAAPLVAGRLARFKSICPELTVWELKTLLQHQSDEMRRPESHTPGA